jgi:hypothetical protein
MDKASNLIIITISAILLQNHSIRFWVDIVGDIGILWSVGFEVFMIWLWWNKYRVLAFVSCLFLLSGALMHVSETTIESVIVSETAKSSTETLTRQQASLEQQLQTYVDNSNKRVGWLNQIQQTEQALADVRRQISENAAHVSVSGNSRNYLALITQAVVLAMMMATQAIAVSKMRNVSETRNTIRNKGIEKTETPEPARVPIKFRENPKVSETPVIRVAPGQPVDISKYQGKSFTVIASEAQDWIPKALQAALQDLDINQAEWCRQKGIKPADLSLAKNHAERKARNQKTAPKAALEQIIQHLAPYMEPEQEPGND